MLTIENIVQKHERKYPEIVGLYLWSQNYEYPSPMSYFLDLIGYSKDEFNDTLGDWSKVTDKIQYLELLYISEALTEYVKNPDGAYQAIKDLVDFGG